MVRHVVLGCAYLVFTGVCLFWPAGTMEWPAAWMLLGFYAAGIFVGSYFVDPEVVRERESVEHGLQSWDAPVSGLGFLFLIVMPLVVAGFDVKRYGWSPPVPAAVRIAAAVVVVLGTLLGWWAMRTNRFFVKFVRIQRERGHHVVTEGPYAYVRHPGYVGGVASCIATPLVLGSLWGLLPACVGGALVVLRTALEDRFLQAELPGYREYAQKVRWRLLPGCW